MGIICILSKITKPVQNDAIESFLKGLDGL